MTSPTAKPHNGRIKDWRRNEVGHENGLGYQILGTFVDHPYLSGSGWTSYVTAHNEETGEIETRNSRYTLVGKETHD